MTYSYFPGCTLKNKAKDLDHYARECAKVLGFELEEIENWQCTLPSRDMMRMLSYFFVAIITPPSSVMLLFYHILRLFSRNSL